MRIYFIFMSLMLCNLSLLSKAFVNINVYGTGLYLPYSIGVVGYIKMSFSFPIRMCRWANS